MGKNDEIVVVENEPSDLAALRAEFSKVGIDKYVRPFENYEEAETALLSSGLSPVAIVCDLDMGGIRHDGGRLMNKVFDSVVDRTGFGMWTVLLSDYDQITLDRVKAAGHSAPHRIFRKSESGQQKCAQLLAPLFKRCPTPPAGCGAIGTVTAKDTVFVYSNKNANVRPLSEFCKLLALPGRPEPPVDRMVVMYRGHFVPITDYTADKLVQYLLRWRALGQADDLVVTKMSTARYELGLEGGIEGAIRSFRTKSELKRLAAALFNSDEPVPMVYRASAKKPLLQPLRKNSDGRSGGDLLSRMYFALDRNDLDTFGGWLGEYHATRRVTQLPASP